MIELALLVMTDGRDEHLDRAIASAAAKLNGPISEWWIHDDTGDDAHRAELKRRYPDFTQLGAGPRRGFGGAIARAWSELHQQSNAKWILHLEDDFVLNFSVSIHDLVRILDANPNLVQLVLKRQPWNELERAAGGIVEQHPEAYEEKTDARGNVWLEHRLFFSTNVSLYRHALIERGWPNVPHSEGIFTHELLKDPNVRFGFFGSRDSPPWVTHIGHARAGKGY